MSPLLEAAYATPSTSRIEPINDFQYTMQDISSGRYEPIAVADKIMTEIREFLQDETRFIAEPKPPQGAVDCLRDILAAAELSILFPDVSAFDGELDVTWTNGRKQITLLCGGRDAKIHYYEAIEGGQPRFNLIANASGETLGHWLQWLKM